jgi:predicted transglutaminase-like cysteine proteinase
MTDTDHYGIIQWWRYPDDGIGACHSYALLKRRLLIEAGLPREALLMTIVWLDHGRGEGHAVITVKTDRGEFILDNLTDDILLWSETPYFFYKRQSQSDPNAWVLFKDTGTSVAMAATHQSLQAH